MCNALLGRLLVVLTALLLLLTWRGGDQANGTQRADVGGEGSSFGTIGAAHAPDAFAPTRGASWLRGAVDRVGWSSFGTFGCERAWFDSPLDDRCQEQRGDSSGTGEFVRHFSGMRGAGAPRPWFDSS